MNIVDFATKRISAKAFDPERKIPEDIISKLYEIIRFSPSSVNSQPWHFIIASHDDAKARVIKSLQGEYTYNEQKVRDASHVIVFCRRTEIDKQHLSNILEKESSDGRFQNENARLTQKKSREMFVNLHRNNRKDIEHWMEKQLYISLGTLLLSASTYNVDTCPMEGFDAAVLDRELKLQEKGYTSVVLVGLGYSGKGDFNRQLPKSRLDSETLFTVL